MTDEVTNISARKDEHLQICLEEDVSSGVSAGFDQVLLQIATLPELNFESIDLSANIFGKRLDAPILISSMTGGSGKTKMFNQILARAANEFNIAMGVGSQRAALVHEGLDETFAIARKEAPNALLFANIGVAQLNEGFGVVECQRAVDMLEADALFIHLNALQEALQPEGNRDFSHLLKKIEAITAGLQVPVVAKEVGCGIDPKTASLLVEAGVAGIDVAGVGGTSWAAVEMYRQSDPVRKELCETYIGWGIPTARALIGLEGLPNNILRISSGGLSNGLDVAKSIAMGADLAGFALKLMIAANQGYETLKTTLELIILELKVAMFLSSAPDLNSLRTKLVQEE
ncbi:MAG: type 2 isopentenyl-diphosphate Delta-isomerase [Anaerolineaceae bacterium]|nr:type 2 isopentenyl-diphosphate Delta-isomerase [Anaerolineaceae bacterium]MDD4042022.1 type 2 isopentenyl-diphosphate Delta-isomerase [Anaerolineaceae bacterium]MDD4577570.1 type 2 isopentenyl-diphosphate Delta-isomerase [Anaerolineaceae bacterium]